MLVRGARGRAHRGMLRSIPSSGIVHCLGCAAYVRIRIVYANSGFGFVFEFRSACRRNGALPLLSRKGVDIFRDIRGGGKRRRGCRNYCSDNHDFFPVDSFVGGRFFAPFSIISQLRRKSFLTMRFFFNFKNMYAG